MKKILFFILIMVGISVYSCQEDNDYPLHRPGSPASMTATKGDTSVFLSWTPVKEAAYYLIVRGYNTIADSVMTTEYEDSKAPDTLTEYRVYAVNENGWRSQRYACDSGYLGIPKGIMPRAPQTVKVSDNNVKGCEIKWDNGRFAVSYEIYRDGKYLTSLTNNSFIDFGASTDINEYEVYSVNDNGKSATAAAASGRKAFVVNDTYENYSIGSVIAPWTFIADRIAYYTEGSPTVTAENGRNGNCLKLSASKIQMLFDWGGVFMDGYYEVSFWGYKNGGTFTYGPNFASWEDKAGEGQWIHYAGRTGLLSAGQTFNMTIASDDNPLYIDDFAIEYLEPSVVE